MELHQVHHRLLVLPVFDHCNHLQEELVAHLLSINQYLQYINITHFLHYLMKITVFHNRAI
jgi:hypothetical protein